MIRKQKQKFEHQTLMQHFLFFLFVCLFVCVSVRIFFFMLILFTHMLCSTVNTLIRFPNDTKLSAFFFLIQCSQQEKKVTTQVEREETNTYVYAL